MSRSVEKVTLVQESTATMSFKHKKFLQTLGCAIVLAYFTLLVYQTFGNTDVEVQTNERQVKPFYHDRNLAEDRSQTELEVPQELTSEFATATATIKPPMTTLDDVFISVKTTKSYHTKRLPIILKTWFQLARKQTWFFTDTDDMEFQIKTNGHMINTNCSSSHSRKALCCKMSVEFDTFLNTDKNQVGSGTIVYLTCGDFGEFVDDKKVKQRIKVFTWTSTSKVEVKIINYGGYIISIKAPDRKLNVHDIVIGFDKLEGYLSKENAYLGCTVGRVANRIANGRMVIEGKEYKLCTNNGPNHLHGGSIGFDKVVWDYSVQENKVILSYVSPDMEEGYPGTLLVNVSFELNTENEFIINYKAMTSKPTIVNLTNHSYFNLAGDHTGAEEIYNHLVLINAKKITEIDDNLIPTGKYTPVDGTVFDFQTSKVLRDVIKNVPASPGFDHNFCLETCGGCNKIAARVKHHCSGRVLEVYTDQPGIQFYTGNFLPEKDTLKGKNGFIKKHGAFCLETQNYPDAVNQPSFPSPLLYPGDTYNTTTIFKFVVE